MEPVTEMLEKLEGVESELANTDLDEALRQHVRTAVEDFKRASAQWRPFEDLHALMLRVSHHLDYETAKQKQIYNLLCAIENDTKTTLNIAKIVAVLFVATVGFWSVVAWWALNDEITSLFHAITGLIHHMK